VNRCTAHAEIDVKFGWKSSTCNPTVVRGTGALRCNSPLAGIACPRALGRWLVVIAAACIGVAADFASAEDDPILDAALNSARALSGAAPAKARSQLATVRALAMKRNRLDVRLAADEAECRLLSDMDVSAVPKVVEAGLAAARLAGESRPKVRLGVLRLRTCGADAMFDRGEGTAAEVELATVLAESADDPALAPAHALALLERGLHRSRRGDLILGQEDLLAACSTLEKEGKPWDSELCLWHLANHYKRVGDSDEALRLMNRLMADAEKRKAAFDEGVYAFGIAQVQQIRGKFDDALRSYRQSLAIATELEDTSGIAYSEHGIGDCLVRLDRPEEALPHIEHAAALLKKDAGDKLQAVRTSVLQATALASLQRAADANAVLAKVGRSVPDYHDDLLLSDWLSVQAKVQSQLGRWQDAYAALAAWRKIDDRVQAQRQSEQSARLRMQFNREKDAADMRALERVNEQGQRLREAQALALGLFIALLLVLSVYIGHKVRQGRRLHLLATTDELTGLANRRAILLHLEDRLRLAKRRRKPLSVLMIDADHFKSINDTYGHGVGDEVLRHLARVLFANQRTHDRLGRWGGEEFLAVLPDAGGSHAAAVAERIRHSVEATPCETTAGAILLTVSIGVATLAEGVATATELLAEADGELYAAKAGGRNAVSSRLARPVAEPRVAAA
jgi:diguanylate cyclase (GGDEF)-like protein